MVPGVYATLPWYPGGYVHLSGTQVGMYTSLVPGWYIRLSPMVPGWYIRLSPMVPGWVFLTVLASRVGISHRFSLSGGLCPVSSLFR